jgi:hypothetical protein
MYLIRDGVAYSVNTQGFSEYVADSANAKRFSELVTHSVKRSVFVKRFEIWVARCRVVTVSPPSSWYISQDMLRFFFFVFTILSFAKVSIITSLI